MNLGKIEKHPFKPFLPEGTRVVLCGTFPPKQDKWSMDFFYPNFYNDMWRIFGLLFFDEKDKFFDYSTKRIDKEGIQKMLEENKIGIGETTLEAIRQKDNASDKFLEVVTPVDFRELLGKIPECKDIVTTGEKAASVVAKQTNTAIPKVGEYQNCKILMKEGGLKEVRHWRMPSTSRAYPMKMEKKAEFYKKMFQEIGVLK